MQILSPLFLSSNINFPVFSILTSFFSITAVPSCFFVFCLRISSFFCFSAADTGSLFPGKTLSL